MSMTKDAEKLLKYIVIKSGEYNVTEVSIEINEITNVPNIEISKKELLDELRKEKFIYDYKENSLGELYAYLTNKGQKYFEEKGYENTVGEKKVVINVNGGQFTVANDNGIIQTTQNNNVLASDKTGKDEKNRELQGAALEEVKSGQKVQWRTTKKKIILLAILLMTVFAAASVINFNKLIGKDKKNEISNQEFAEKFCEKVKVVLLSSGEGQIKEVKAMLDVLKDECGGDSALKERYIYTLSECGLICCQQGYIHDASTFTKDALDLANEFEISKDNCDLIALCHSNYAVALLKIGDSKAEENFLKAIRWYNDFEINNIKLASTYMDLANYYIDRAEYAKALENVEKADNVLIKLNKSNSIQMGLSHIIRARIYQHINEKRVPDELKIAEGILENNKPESNMYLPSLYGDLGVYFRPKHIGIAEEYFKKELDIAQRMQGEFGEDTIDAEINLASIASDYGRVQEAKSRLSSVALKCEERYSERKIDCAYTYVKLANIYRELGNYSESINYYEDALSIFENEYGTNHPILATVYGNKAIALLDSDYKQEKEAFFYLDKAINILRYNCEDSQSIMAELLRWKAELYCEQGKFEDAVPLLEEAKQIYKMLYGDISDSVIEVDLKIGNAYVMLNNANSYSSLYYAVARYKSMYGESSYRMIEPYIMLGDCFYYELGEGNTESQKEKAIFYYNKAEEILEVFDEINTEENAYLYKKLGTAWYMLHQDKQGAQRESDMRKSLLCYKKAQDIYVIRQREDSDENLWLTTRIGRIYAYLGDEDKAIECLKFVENRKDSIVNENQQLTIYLDMLGICVMLNDREKCKEYADFLKAVIESSPTAADAIGVECVNWINRYAD